jgi:hypothetical protein
LSTISMNASCSAPFHRTLESGEVAPSGRSASVRTPGENLMGRVRL